MTSHFGNRQNLKEDMSLVNLSIVAPYAAKVPTNVFSSTRICFLTLDYPLLNTIRKPDDQWSCKNAHLTPGPGIYFNAFIHIYIAPGQGQTTTWRQMLMSTESPYHFAHLLQVLKQSL